MRHAEIRCAIGRHLAEQVRSYPSFEAIKRTWRLGCEPTRFADEENIVVLKEYRQLIVLRHRVIQSNQMSILQVRVQLSWCRP